MANEALAASKASAAWRKRQSNQISNIKRHVSSRKTSSTKKSSGLSMAAAKKKKNSKAGDAVAASCSNNSKKKGMAPQIAIAPQAKAKSSIMPLAACITNQHLSSSSVNPQQHQMDGGGAWRMKNKSMAHRWRKSVTARPGVAKAA